YDGDLPSKQLLNAATGGSDWNRCEALKGVLQWNRDRAHGGRDLHLPVVTQDFCSRNTCPELLPLIEDQTLVESYVDGKPTGQIDKFKIFFDPDNYTTPRLLSNRLLFDAVRSVPTDFKLSARYAWLLRYTARWVVAHRIWQLCAVNRPLLEK